MEEKDKKEINENPNKDLKSDNKELAKKSDENKEIPIEEIEKLLSHLKEQIDLNSENVRIIKIDRSKPNLKSKIINYLITYIFDIILIFSINGYIKFSEAKIFNLLIFSIVFSTIELFFRAIFVRYLLRLMVASLGTVLIPLTTISFIITWFIIPGLTPTSTLKVILFFIIFLIVRALIKIFLLKRNDNFIEIRGVRRR